MEFTAHMLWAADSGHVYQLLFKSSCLKLHQPHHYLCLKQPFEFHDVVWLWLWALSVRYLSWTRHYPVVFMNYTIIYTWDDINGTLCSQWRMRTISTHWGLNRLKETVVLSFWIYWSLFLRGKSLYRFLYVVPSLRPSEAIWRPTIGSTLAQIMTFFPNGSNHYLSQCRFIIQMLSVAFTWEWLTKSTHELNP